MIFLRYTVPKYLKKDIEKDNKFDILYNNFELMLTLL